MHLKEHFGMKHYFYIDRTKLEWIDPNKPTITKAIHVMDLVGGQQGFKGILSKLRSEKTPLPPILKSKREKSM